MVEEKKNKKAIVSSPCCIYISWYICIYIVHTFITHLFTCLCVCFRSVVCRCRCACTYNIHMCVRAYESIYICTHIMCVWVNVYMYVRIRVFSVILSSRGYVRACTQPRMRKCAFGYETTVRQYIIIAYVVECAIKYRPAFYRSHMSMCATFWRIYLIRVKHLTIDKLNICDSCDIQLNCIRYGTDTYYEQFWLLLL